MADETVGERLRRLRRSANLSQRDISSPGVSYAYISRIEAGARTPSVKALRMLAGKLGVTVRYLETGVESEVEAALSLAGLSLAEVTDDERDVIERAASAWSKVGAYEATLKVLRDRDRRLVEDLSQTLESARERQRRSSGLAAVS